MSLKYKQAIAAMYAYFAANKPSGVAVIYGGDDPTAPPDNAPWIRFNVQHNDGFQASMGSPNANRFERRGILTIQIFQPENQYGLVAQGHADTIHTLYSGLEDSGIHYFDTFVREAGNDGFGWYQINVVTTFKYEQIT